MKIRFRRLAASASLFLILLLCGAPTQAEQGVLVQVKH